MSDPIADLEEALRLLEQAPCGGVGPDSYPLAALEEFHEQGRCAEDDAMLDLCQHVFLLVQRALVALGDTI